MGSDGKRHIPDHVTFTILPRLPAKSLVRFKRVSKAWHSFINALNSDNRKLIFSTLHSIHSVDIGANTNNMKARNLNFNLGKLLHQLIGCCNGLLCIVVQTDVHAGEADLVIWNPWTGRYKAVPISGVDLTEKMYGFTYKNTYGFCFDQSTNDYKIVRLVKGDGITVFQIYSSNSDSWKSGILPCYIFPMSYERKYSATFIDRSLYWRIDHIKDTKDRWRALFGGSSVILCFSLVDENFRVILPPDDVAKGAEFDLFDFGGCLGLIHCHARRRAHVDIWTRNEHNWTKSMCIPRLQELHNSLYLAPVFFYNGTGEVLLHEKDTYPCRGKEVFYLYSLEKKTFRKFNIEGMEQFTFHIDMPYTPSLTSLTR
ncbi:hypothetical protein CUMW_128220 [Citrus unshiu]|uniref:F-box domain-containing protein n=1 Tax=Citrus unshiu TaxID=55188 RepID=A0A2H5PE48_CITUN|nr:F-box/kelch-repeat protein At3g23880-like [Citrus x clementina]GAY50636.1 hypothetical protein CUMW_128220 [Citrus unshiu]